MANILIVEDDALVRTLLDQFLTSKGYTVTLASNGREGLSSIQQKRPDLMITDMIMPEMDGMELIEIVHKADPDLPIISMSGGMRDVPLNILPLAQQIGSYRSFQKPVSLVNLLCATKELLGESLSLV